MTPREKEQEQEVIARKRVEKQLTKNGKAIATYLRKALRKKKQLPSWDDLTVYEYELQAVTVYDIWDTRSLLGIQWEELTAQYVVCQLEFDVDDKNHYGRSVIDLSINVDDNDFHIIECIGTLTKEQAFKILKTMIKTKTNTPVATEKKPRKKAKETPLPTTKEIEAMNQLKVQE